MDRIRKVIEHLNALTLGDLGALDAKLLAAQQELGELEIDDQQQVVSSARACLSKGDVREFRRLVSQAVSRLGHLR